MGVCSSGPQEVVSPSHAPIARKLNAGGRMTSESQDPSPQTASADATQQSSSNEADSNEQDQRHSHGIPAFGKYAAVVLTTSWQSGTHCRFVVQCGPRTLSSVEELAELCIYQFDRALAPDSLQRGVNKLLKHLVHDNPSLFAPNRHSQKSQGEVVPRGDRGDGLGGGHSDQEPPKYDRQEFVKCTLLTIEAVYNHYFGHNWDLIDEICSVNIPRIEKLRMLYPAPTSSASKLQSGLQVDALPGHGNASGKGEGTGAAAAGGGGGGGGGAGANAGASGDGSKGGKSEHTGGGGGGGAAAAGGSGSGSGSGGKSKINEGGKESEQSSSSHSAVSCAAPGADDLTELAPATSSNDDNGSGNGNGSGSTTAGSSTVLRAAMIEKHLGEPSATSALLTSLMASLAHQPSQGAQDTSWGDWGPYIVELTNNRMHRDKLASFFRPSSSNTNNRKSSPAGPHKQNRPRDKWCLLLFFADYCSSCRAFKPEFSRAAQILHDQEESKRNSPPKEQPDRMSAELGGRGARGSTTLCRDSLALLASDDDASSPQTHRSPQSQHSNHSQHSEHAHSQHSPHSRHNQDRHSLSELSSPSVSGQDHDRQRESFVDENGDEKGDELLGINNNNNSHPGPGTGCGACTLQLRPPPADWNGQERGREDENEKMGDGRLGSERENKNKNKNEKKGKKEGENENKSKKGEKKEKEGEKEESNGNSSSRRGEEHLSCTLASPEPPLPLPRQESKPRRKSHDLHRSSHHYRHSHKDSKKRPRRHRRRQSQTIVSEGENIAEENIAYFRVNGPKNATLCNYYNVTSFPSLKLIKNGHDHATFPMANFIDRSATTTTTTPTVPKAENVIEWLRSGGARFYPPGSTPRSRRDSTSSPSPSAKARSRSRSRSIEAALQSRPPPLITSNPVANDLTSASSAVASNGGEPGVSAGDSGDSSDKNKDVDRSVRASKSSNLSTISTGNGNNGGNPTYGNGDQSKGSQTHSTGSGAKEEQKGKQGDHKRGERSHWEMVLLKAGIDMLPELSADRERIKVADMANALRKRLKATVSHDPAHTPYIIFMGGGMGAGKSSAVKLLAKTEFWKSRGSGVVVVEADAMKMRDPVFQSLIAVEGGGAASSHVHKRSTEAAEELLLAALHDRCDVLFDGTMMWAPFVKQTVAMIRDSGHRHTRGVGYVENPDGTVIEQYWVQGEALPQTPLPYKLVLVGVSVDPGVAVRRGILRQIATGRGVATRLQLRSHMLFAKSFASYVSLFDEVVLFDNSDSSTHLHLHVNFPPLLNFTNTIASKPASTTVSAAPSKTLSPTLGSTSNEAKSNTEGNPVTTIPEMLRVSSASIGGTIWSCDPATCPSPCAVHAVSPSLGNERPFPRDGPPTLGPRTFSGSASGSVSGSGSGSGSGLDQGQATVLPVLPPALAPTGSAPKLILSKGSMFASLLNQQLSNQDSHSQASRSSHSGPSDIIQQPTGSLSLPSTGEKIKGQLKKLLSPIPSPAPSPHPRRSRIDEDGARGSNGKARPEEDRTRAGSAGKEDGTRGSVAQEDNGRGSVVKEDKVRGSFGKDDKPRTGNGKENKAWTGKASVGVVIDNVNTDSNGSPSKSKNGASHSPDKKQPYSSTGTSEPPVILKDAVAYERFKRVSTLNVNARCAAELFPHHVQALSSLPNPRL